MAHADGELRGIKGWLLFFVMTLAVFGPAAAVVSTYVDLYGDPRTMELLGPRWPLVLAYDWGIAAVGCAGQWFCAWRLIAVRTPATPRIVIAGLWLLGPVFLIVSLVLASILFGTSLGTITADAGANLVRPFFYAGVWTAYLLLSKRVANTYRVSTEDLAATFS